MEQILKNKSYILFIIIFILGFATSFSLFPYNYIYINFLTFPFLLYFLNIAKKLNYNNYFFFLIGWFFGFGYFLSGLYWISISLTFDESFKPLIPFAMFLVPAFLAAFYGIATLLLKKFVKQKISFILLFSLIFSILEFLRGNIFGGFPWNLIAYSWTWSLEIIQIISIIGTYSLNLISITIFSMSFIFFYGKNFSKKNYWFIGIVFVAFVINYLFGLVVLKKDNEKIFNKYDFLVKIISPNIELKEFIEGKSSDKILKELIKISKAKVDQKTIFIWPEGMFPGMYLHEMKKYKNIFSNEFSNLHLIIFGINKNEYNGIEKVYNSMVVVNNDLEIVESYEKNKLVPFGEFLPFERYFNKLGLETISFGYKSFSKGAEREVIEVKNNFFEFNFLPIICYEIIYPGQLNTKKQKTDLIINISEDGWFGKSIGPFQHFSKAIFRAVEEGNYIARSANNGISAFIDPKGRIVKKLQPGDADLITVNLPINKNITFFSRYGNKIFFLIILLYIFLIFYFKKT